MGVRAVRIRECFEKHFDAIKDMHVYRIPSHEHDAEQGRYFIKRFKGLVLPLGVKYIQRLRLDYTRDVIAFYRSLDELGITKLSTKELSRLSVFFMRSIEGEFELDGYTPEQWKLLKIRDKLGLYIPEEVKWRGNLGEMRGALVDSLREHYTEQVALFGDTYIEHFKRVLDEERKEEPIRIRLDDLMRMKDAKALFTDLKYLVTDIPESIYAQMRCGTEGRPDIVYRAVAPDKMVIMEPGKTKLCFWMRNYIFRMLMSGKGNCSKRKANELRKRIFRLLMAEKQKVCWLGYLED
jgi:hypothetical protein